MLSVLLDSIFFSLLAGLRPFAPIIVTNEERFMATSTAKFNDRDNALSDGAEDGLRVLEENSQISLVPLDPSETRIDDERPQVYSDDTDQSSTSSDSNTTRSDSSGNHDESSSEE
jgi:hypothetical protein